MAGLYIHIPFCVKRCIYCDFYSTTDSNLIDRYVKTLRKEISVRSSFFSQYTIDTIYLGGGTPTQLTIDQLNELFEEIARFTSIKQVKECTIEANPDDLSAEYIQKLRTLPINRLSIGIQSFQDHHLKFLNRRHTASQAIEAVRNAQKMGFSNISIDLMYGLPNQAQEEWVSDLQTATSLGVQHISAYCLTYEPDTHLFRKLQAGEVEEINEEVFRQLQDSLIGTLRSANFHRYEVSNYALLGHESQHNGSYWRLVPYLGIGASAHSYVNNIRSWNPNSLSKYCSQLEENNYKPEEEYLTQENRHNEYIMLGLRTASGISLKEFEQHFGDEALSLLLTKANKFIETHHLRHARHHLSCTDEGFNILNTIISELMI